MENQPKKNETKLKIIIFGQNINMSLINNLYGKKNLQGSKNRFNNTDYIKVKHTFFEWQFLIFQNSNIQTIKKLIKEDYTKKYFQHVLLVFIDDFSNQMNIIKNIEENLSTIFFPFIIFISSNVLEKSEKICEIENLGIDIDYRTILFISNKCQSLELLNILWKICCYYNQLGNSLSLPCLEKYEVNISKYIHSFNFFIIGKTGVGKSTFINILCGDLVALERAGSNVTVGIRRYRCLNSPIYLYDSEGFSSGKELFQTKNKIIETLSELNKTKQTINGIFYLFNGQSKRTFDDNEEELINELFSKGFDIYFLINFMSEKKNNKKTKDMFIEENEFRFNNSDFNKKFEDNLFVVNLKKDDFNCHGLDIVFNKIYEKFNNEKIDLIALKNLNDNNDIIPLVKKSSFFKYINSKNDAIAYLRSICRYEIYSFSTLCGLVGGFDVLPFSDLPVIYCIQGSMIISLALTFGIKLKEKEAFELLKSLIKSAATTVGLGIFGFFMASGLKLIPGVGTVIGGIINGSVGASTTIAIGELALDYFSKNFGDKEIKEFFYQRAEACNNVIEYFKFLKENFENNSDYINI